MFGLLNLHKPTGGTSRDVVNQVQRLVRGLGYDRKFKLGHAGTLDPIAEGVLVVALGSATRLIPYVQAMPKTYDATFLLGQGSASDDIETECQPPPNAPRLDRATLEREMTQFIGTIEQVPPAYSAVKIGGERAYDLARQGLEVRVQSRPVTIHSLRIMEYEYPQLRMEIVCGSGTYVRSLGRDLAKSCGTAAVMSALVRTAIGDFTLDHAVCPDQLTESSLISALLPARKAVSGMPQAVLSAAQIEEIRHGRAIDDLRVDSSIGEVAALDNGERLVALLRRRELGWGPKMVFALD